MITPSASSVRVATYGMDEHARRMLDMVFQKQAQGGYVLTTTDEAEASIFDMDSFGAGVLWQEYRQKYPKMPTLLMSLNQPKNPDGIYLAKPIQLQQLLDALEKIQHQVVQQRASQTVPATPVKPTAPKTTPSCLTHPQGLSCAARTLSDDHSHHYRGYSEDSVCGAQTDIDPHNPTDIEKVSYNPERRLQSVFEKALSFAKLHDGIISIEGLAAPFYIWPQHQQVMTALDETNLRTLCMLPLLNKKIDIKLLKEEEWRQQRMVSTVALRGCCIASYQWNIALWSALGRVPQGTPLDIPIILLHWPNLSRLQLTPHALRIAALWAERPYSLLETAKVLNIPQRYVFAFYSATHALRLAFPERRTRTRSEEVPSSAPQANPKRSLFKRILAHLSS